MDKTNAEKLAFSLWDEISTENMLKTLERFSQLHRYSGTPDGEISADYLIDKLTEYGVACHKLPYEGYLSIPVKTKLRVLEPVEMEIPAIACAYSAETKGLKAELHYDTFSETKPAENTMGERLWAFRDKIVLSREGAATGAMRAVKGRALGLIHMWPTGESVIHHGILGGSWGAPSAEESHLIADIPMVHITKSDGERLIDLCAKGAVKVELDIEMNTGVRVANMPIADIPGKSGHYVLVAGHYDSWYEGITDNGVANAIMLEMARVFQGRRGELEHGIRFAWWAGHSDGRYGGSTWYCDNNWEDVNQHCLAYIMLDICGCKNTARILPRGTMMEGPKLLPEIIRDLTGELHETYVPMTKSGDQSFFGAGVPISLYGMNEPGPGGDTNFANVGGGAWWHSSEDSLDKMDVDLMLRDAKFNTHLVSYLCTAKRIPVQMGYFVEKMKGFLAALSEGLAPGFNAAPAVEAFDELAPHVARLETALAGCKDDDVANRIILDTAGDLVHIAYSSADPYHHDPAWLPGKTPPFAMMHLAKGVTPDNAPADRYLFHKTGFKRRCNRVVGEVSRLIERIQCQLARLDDKRGK